MTLQFWLVLIIALPETISHALEIWDRLKRNKRQ
jgi:hypothetical protein